jgi:flagellar motor switch protein FliG
MALRSKDASGQPKSKKGPTDTKKRGSPPGAPQAGKKVPAAPGRIDFTITDEGIFDRQASAPKKGSSVPAQKRAPTSDTATPSLPKRAIANATRQPEPDPGSMRAAKLLIALGPDQAAHILKEMKESEVEKIVAVMLRIREISTEEKREILDEFHQSVNYFEPPVRGGIEQARAMLTAGLGEEKAHEILGRLNRRDLKLDFEFLEQIEPPTLANALSTEHPQTTAVALSFIQPKIAAAVMKFLPEKVRTEVAIRIARTSKTHPDAVQSIARVLREKFEKRSGEVYSETGGAETLANILNHMDRSTEDGILGVLGQESPKILEEVREMLYTFEELTSLETKEMRLLLSKINDDFILAAALRGAPDEMRRHFFNALSQNRAADILDEMDRRGPLSLKEINEARAFVVNAARRLDEEGSIVIKKDKEDYV